MAIRNLGNCDAESFVTDNFQGIYFRHYLYVIILKIDFKIFWAKFYINF